LLWRLEMDAVSRRFSLKEVGVCRRKIERQPRQENEAAIRARHVNEGTPSQFPWLNDTITTVSGLGTF
jgi:hypothetical protein